MQDIKNITSRKRSGIKGLLGLSPHRQPPRNSFRRTATEPQQRRRRLRFLLPIIACLLAAYPIFAMLVSAKKALSSVNRVPAPPPAKLDFSQSYRMAHESLPFARYDGGRLISQRPEGTTVYYSINRDLQERVTKVMEDNEVPYAVFVAVEPKTGRIIALASHSEVDPSWEAQSAYNLYPMASLFKIVTAAAALEQQKVTPDTVIAFRGRLTSENPRYWQVGQRHGNQEMDLTSAMGKSVNPVFGRLAGDLVGKDGVIAEMERFGFNQTLFPGTPIPACSGTNPQDDAALKQLGAGLCREVKVSPVYAALMMAAVANRGVMLYPQLASEIRGNQGKLLYSDDVTPVRSIIAPGIADQLSRMMSTTVSEGTSRKVFRDRRGRPKLAAVNIAAKTGSINGTEPPGYYSWFAAYAPINDPKIALVALVINGGKWRIKASLLGEQALEEFFLQ